MILINDILLLILLFLHYWWGNVCFTWFSAMSPWYHGCHV